MSAEISVAEIQHLQSICKIMLFIKHNNYNPC